MQIKCLFGLHRVHCNQHAYSPSRHARTTIVSLLNKTKWPAMLKTWDAWIVTMCRELPMKTRLSNWTWRLVLCMALVVVASSLGFPSERSLLRTEIGTRDLQSATLQNYLNYIGAEHRLKFAIEDRRIRRGEDIIDELGESVITLQLAEGGLESQLRSISEKLPSLTWSECEGILWIRNKMVAKESPLESRIDRFEYDGYAAGICLHLHKHDQRIPKWYGTVDGEPGWPWKFPLKVSAKETSVRNVLSRALVYHPSFGVIFRFVEVSPRNVLTKEQLTSMPQPATNYFGVHFDPGLSIEQRSKIRGVK